MRTITTHEARTHLLRYLSEVEGGAAFLIARGRTPVAMLVPIEPVERKARPKVGESLGPAFAIPDDAFSPLTSEELKAWGL